MGASARGPAFNWVLYYRRLWRLYSGELHGDGYLSPSPSIPIKFVPPPPTIPVKTRVFPVQIFTNLKSLHFAKIINVYYSTISLYYYIYISYYNHSSL